MNLSLSEGQAFTVPTLLTVFLVGTYLAAYQLSYEMIDITVEDKNTVFNQNADPHEGYTPHNWLIYTEGEVFKVSADWTRGEFRAAERYHSLEVGQTYTVYVAGWRIPEVNWYRNIVRIEPALR